MHLVGRPALGGGAADREAFHHEHLTATAPTPPSRVEILTWGIRVEIGRGGVSRPGGSCESIGAAQARDHVVFAFGKVTARLPVPARGRSVHLGPAIIDEPTTTVVIPPGGWPSSTGTQFPPATRRRVSTTGFDPVLLSVLANAFDGIVREMTNGLLRSARSSVINTARDFSCSILTADNQLLASAEGCPVHVFGSEPLGESMSELHKDLAPGDAFLHNDPYRGNSHAADHSILVPIFIDGVHLFTGVAKAHQADCGNAIPTTFSPTARDVYEEGALIFPCVRIQRDYTDVADIIRMCRVRIRVPDQWYGDYLATVGAARIAERRVQELVAKHGIDTVTAFVDEWFDYSERLAASVIAEMPAGTMWGTTTHDPFPGTDVRVSISPLRWM